MRYLQKVFFACCIAGLVILLAGTFTGCATKADTKQQQDPQVVLDQAKQAFIEKDYERVLQLVLPLAITGNDEAQYALGYLYHRGLGVEKNDSQAMNWIQRAAAQGNKKALDALH